MSNSGTKMNWRGWCRLCGTCDSISCDPEIIEIIGSINAEINLGEVRLCINCNDYLSEFNQFMQRTKVIQSMFLELESAGSEIEYINEIRNRYGLENLDSSLYNEPNVMSGALDIKIESDISLEMTVDENLSDNVAYDAQYVDLEALEEDNLESETSSTIEQFSESKLTDEEDKFSETEDTLVIKTRRKGRKSVDEKLFDFICHICKQEFQKMSQLSNHCRRTHNVLPQVMCYCGKALGTWKRLLIHKQKHFPEKLDYECKECKVVYKMKASFLNHMKSKHGPDAKKFVCYQCARCFKDSRTLMAHEKTHLPDELKLIYPCEICEKKFVNKNSLKSHITSVHEMATLFTCEQCGKSFSTKSNLKSHLYSHSNEKNVQCDVCSARFKNMDSLRKHKKTHLEKSHECKICKNRYRNRNNLKAHMVCHSDDKPYQCTYCPQSYKRSKDLKCHMNLHSGERPYQCQFCNRTFVNGSNCRKHKLKDHPQELENFESLHGRGKAAVFALHTIKQNI